MKAERIEQEIDDIYNQVDMKTFDTMMEAKMWVDRKAQNFEKIFELVVNDKETVENDSFYSQEFCICDYMIGFNIGVTYTPEGFKTFWNKWRME